MNDLAAIGGAVALLVSLVSLLRVVWQGGALTQTLSQLSGKIGDLEDRIELLTQIPLITQRLERIERMTSDYPTTIAQHASELSVLRDKVFSLRHMPAVRMPRKDEE